MATVERTAAHHPAPVTGAAKRPAQRSPNPILRLVDDLVTEHWARTSFPPGPSDLNLGRTLQMARDPLPILLSLYERHGPIFSVRILHTRVVWMLGPEANHYITVTDPESFNWREGSFGDLIPLLGDGLLTIDGAYHDRARRIMMPAFHRERIGAATETMAVEAEAALAGWRAGEVVDVYHWARDLAMRIAMRALLGLDPDDAGKGRMAAEHFERALSFYGIDFHLRLLRGPRSPFRRMVESRRVLDRIVYGEIAQRRASPDPGRRDILSLLLAARDEDGSALADEEVRDQVMTLMFAGHDTATSTLSFLLYELARNPATLERVASELDTVLGGDPPGPEQLHGRLPYLDMVLDETLRLYPPAWVGPRRAVRDFEFAGHRVPAGAYVNYSSWASHRIPEVFPDPEAFIPERFERERKAALPRGAYVPFGGGSRICIGKRFGQTEVKLVASMLLQRHRVELLPGRTMTIRQAPTLTPEGGLEMRVRERA
ncbi:MAG TPA: cytochrome P450 [Solirubrobacterales bacterium]|nr:cytochrome P450 [Solirubrobacterales bacterium]